MNDEFLYQLRKPPPEDFARRLKARLDRQAPASAPPKRSVNLYALIALLLGGTAFAFVSPTVRNAALAWVKELRAEQPPEQPVQQAKVAKEAPPPAPVAPDNTPRFQTSWKWGGDASSRAAGAPATPIRDRITLISTWPSSALTSFIDRVSRVGAFEDPNIQQSSIGHGIPLFCRGVGIKHLDVLLVQHRMSRRQLESCAQNGVEPVIEIKVGYEAMVLAVHASNASLAVSPRDVFLALAHHVPDPTDPQRSIPNPNTTWRQVNPSLPDVKIVVIGPAPKSSLHEAFMRLIMMSGCSAAGVSFAMPSPEYPPPCTTLRTDGAYIDGGGDDNAVLRSFASNPTALGVFSYNALPHITGRYTPLPVDGVAPSYATLSTGQYRAARTLYVYIKRPQVEFVPDLVSFSKAYAMHLITPQGMVPLSEAERAKSRADALSLTNVQSSKLTGR